MAKKAKGKMNISLDELGQEIDLKKYLGRKPTNSEKTNFADLAIDTIENRTLDGKNVDGRKFEKYSKEYAEAKGVSRSSVDLFLDGKMLEGIGRRKSKERVDVVYLQMKKGKETKKAFNHNTGDTLPQREFFGITDAEAKRIAAQIKEEKTATKKARKVVASDSILRDTLSLLELEQEF